MLKLVGRAGFEPATNGLKVHKIQHLPLLNTVDTIHKNQHLKKLLKQGTVDLNIGVFHQFA